MVKEIGIQVNYFKIQEVLPCYLMIMKSIQSKMFKKLLMIEFMRSLLILKRLINIGQKLKQSIKQLNLVLTWLLAQIKQIKLSLKINNLMFANALCSDQIILQFPPVSMSQCLFQQSSLILELLYLTQTLVCNYLM